MRGGVMPPQKLPVIGEDDNVSESPFDDLDISSIERVSDPDLSDIDLNDLNIDESVNMSDLSAIEPDNSEINEITMNEDVTFGDESTSNPENNTTIMDESSGGRTRRKRMHKNHKRGTRKHKRGTRKHKKLRSRTRSISRKYKKGGSNIGCNTNDPNFSIYNTNMLKLFPYKA